MNLSEFVKDCLLEISSGINMAIEETSKMANKNRTAINPASQNTNHSPPKDITFDIALSVQEENSASGSAGIRIFSVKIGADAKNGVTNQQVSRVTFSIPVAWPSVVINEHKPISSFSGISNSSDF